MGRKAKYDFKDYQVGEKRLITAEPDKMVSVAASVSVCAHQAGKKYDMKFSTTRTEDGIEVTRIA